MPSASSASSAYCVCVRPRGEGCLNPGPASAAVTIRRALGGQSICTLLLDVSATVHELKVSVQRQTGTPAREQRLLLDTGASSNLPVSSPPAPEVPRTLILEDTTTIDEVLWRLRHTTYASRFQERHRDGIKLKAELPTELTLLLVRMEPSFVQVMEALASGEVPITDLDESMRSNRDVVLAAVRFTGCALAHASHGLRADREVVQAAIASDPLAFEFAAEELQRDPELAQEALQGSPLVLQFIPEDLRKDRALALAAVRSSGQVLQYLPDDLRNDREVVYSAVKSTWRALAYASADVRNDREFVLKVVQGYGSALQHASSELQGDREVVMSAVRNSGWALSCASEALRNDRECVLAAVETNPAAAEFASESVRSDLQIVMAEMSGSGRRRAGCGIGLCTIA